MSRIAINHRRVCWLLLWVSIVLVASQGWSATEAIVETLDGKTQRGELNGLATDSLEIITSQGPIKLATTAVLSVKLAEPIVAKASLRIELVDGSQLAASQYQVTGGRARVLLVGEEKLELTLPTKVIRWVRFENEPNSEKPRDDWSKILATKVDSDVLVIRKKRSLDYHEGTLGNVDEETIHFELDGNELPVKRPKVEGLIYYQAKGDELPEAIARASATGGSQIEIKSISLDEEQVKMVTPAGVEMTWPLKTLSRLDFSTANIQFLSDLEPEAFQYQPFFAGSEELPDLVEFHKPRRDIGFEQNQLRLDGKSCLKGLALHSRSTVSYRLPGKFSRFTAVVGIDDSVRDAGNAKVEIRGDNKMIWEGVCRGTEAAQALDLDIHGIKRLEILVDFGGDFDAGDVVDLCDAKVTK